MAANSIETQYQEADGFTPTPVISRAIIRYNAEGHRALADGILITPSHNPPEDGGIKYNPPGGGPADTDVTGWIETRANALMAAGNIDVKRCRPEELAAHRCIRATDFAENYIKELGSVIDMAAISKAGLNMGEDPMGGAAVAYWPRIADMHGLKLTVVNTAVRSGICLHGAGSRWKNPYGLLQPSGHGPLGWLEGSIRYCLGQ